jgi:hypothetical protein
LGRTAQSYEAGSLKFVTDENLGNLGKALRMLGRRDVDALQTYFTHGTPDEEWIPFVGQHGIVVLTKDHALYEKTAMRQLLSEHKVGLVISISHGMKLWQQSSMWLKVLDKLETLAPEPKPFVYKLYKNATLGKFQLDRPPKRPATPPPATGSP